MRRILPRRSFVFADDFCASNGERPGVSSEGLYPSDAKGLVLSPVEIYRFPSGPNKSDPPVWQHWSRCVTTSMICFSDVRSSLLSAKTNLDTMFAVFSG